MHLVSLVFLWTLTILSVRAEEDENLKHIYYQGVGHFDLQFPWGGRKRSLPPPASPQTIDIQFYLATRNTKDKSVLEWRVNDMEHGNTFLKHLKHLDYDSGRPKTVVHIHGLYFDSNWNWNYTKNVAMPYLHKEDVNIIFVDWGRHFLDVSYSQLAANTRVVGAVAARFIERLIGWTNLKPCQIHIIGFSLGAHVAGYIGKEIPNIDRITGLDPAQPLFEKADPMYRLHHTDAHFVDVLHTNAERFVPFFGFGIRAPIGHVDFYFNGGVHQPGCIVTAGKVFKKFLKFRLKELFGDGRAFTVFSCSHLKATEYWAESLLNPNCIMWGVPRSKMNQITLGVSQRLKKRDCSKRECVPVGLDTFKYTTSGVFDVTTNLAPPYCNPKLWKNYEEAGVTIDNDLRSISKCRFRSPWLDSN